MFFFSIVIQEILDGQLLEMIWRFPDNPDIREQQKNSFRQHSYRPDREFPIS